MYCKSYQTKRKPGQSGCPYARRNCPHGLHSCENCGAFGHGAADCRVGGRIPEKLEPEIIRKRPPSPPYASRATSSTSMSSAPSNSHAREDVVNPSPSPLLTVKEESDDEMRCSHTMHHDGGIPFPKKCDLEIGIWLGNELESGKINAILQWLDASLMAKNKRGWFEIDMLLREHAQEFKYWKMSTNNSKKLGFLCECKKCGRTLAVYWDRDAADDILEIQRRLLRSYFGYGTASEARGQILR